MVSVVQFLALALQVGQSAPSLTAIQAPVLRASGALEGGAFLAVGHATIHGAQMTFRMTFDGRGRFRIDYDGSIPQSDGFDGRTCWTIGPSRATHRVSEFGKDSTLLGGWIVTGSWADDRLTRLRLEGDGSVALSVVPKGGLVEGKVLLDPITSLPKSLSFWSETGGDEWKLSSYKRFGGRTLPTHIVDSSGGQEQVMDIDSVVPVRRTEFTMPVPDRSGDAPTRAEIPVRRVMGYMFVRPTVNGKDVGWFFLDTGADVMCVDPGVAKQLALPEVGKDATSGAVQFSRLEICTADEVRLGGISARNCAMVELPDLAPISKALGLPIAGVCGYDVICRGAFEFDPSRDVIVVCPPGSGSLPPGARWNKIEFGSNTPLTWCEFSALGSKATQRGLFALDTGSGSTVDFFTPAVQKFGLLGTQKVAESRTGGAGGSAASKRGKIEWFKLGAKRFESPTVGFQLTKVGVFSTPYFTGNVGSGFMGKTRMLLDYRNERVAFGPLAESTAKASVMKR